MLATSALTEGMRSYHSSTRMTPTHTHARISRTLLLILWRGYKLLFSPIFGSSCRFYPTCSHYAYLLLANENPLRAMWRIIYRLLRCQPFAQSGVDYPIITLPIARAIMPFVTPFVPHRATQSQNLAHIRITHWLIPLSPIKVACSPCLASLSLTIAQHSCPCFLIPTFRSINEKR